MKSVPAIAFDYRPSRRVVVAVVVVGLLAVLAICLSGIDGRLKIALCAAGLLYGGYSTRNFIRPPWRRFAWHPAGHWRLHDANGIEAVAELRRGFVRGRCIVLELTARGRSFSVVLAPDNADDDLQRRLRVRLARVSHSDASGQQL